MKPVHVPVLPAEVETLLETQVQAPVIIDGTLGEGGHSEMFLKKYPQARVFGVDADSVMVKRASERLAEWSDRLTLINGWSDHVLGAWEGPAADIILMDLGISVFHYTNGERGFSFGSEEMPDMRLDGSSTLSAFEIVNKWNEKDIADLIYKYGEERFSRRIAASIVNARKNGDIDKASDLAEIVVSAIPYKFRHGRIHGATKTFQALRIAVNDELGHLERFLESAPGILAPGGRLGIISFHSMEDRIVKRAFRNLDRRFGGEYTVVTKKPVTASFEEIKNNPPSRSAKLRVLEKPGIPGGV